jgi:hypothetical protein
MKKNLISLHVIFLTIILGITFSGCSKEKIVIPQTTDEALFIDNSTARTGNWGSVTGLILPLNKEVAIYVFNSNFSTGNFYYTKDGSFRVDRIPTGIYSVAIRYYQTSGFPESDLPTGPGKMLEYLINDVKVGHGTIIDLGVIKLQ